jgi:hypothetical protein
MNQEQRIKELEAEAEWKAIDAYPIYPIYADQLDRLGWKDYIKHLQVAFKNGYLSRLNDEQEDKRSVATEAPSTTEADKITNNPLLGEQVILKQDIITAWNSAAGGDAYNSGEEYYNANYGKKQKL